jgi:hypothetical protein
MKLNLSFLLVITVLLALLLPQAVRTEELINEVFVLVRNDKLLAFSGLGKNWFEKKLHSGETVIKSTYDGHVAIAYTTERALAFSAIKNRWTEERFRIRESVTSISAEGNVATVITNIRALGFNAKTGGFIESLF